ncbi:MAG: DUF4398 domain-containing protein [Pseudohongiellaceae bacterium]
MTQLKKRTSAGRICGALGLFMAVIMLGACASAPPAPVASITAARQAISGAEQAGARQYAGAELDEAHEKLVMAERYVNDERMVEAERTARESLIAAELASARTESAKAAEINREMTRGSEALVEEMRRTGGQR